MVLLQDRECAEGSPNGIWLPDSRYETRTLNDETLDSDKRIGEQK